MKKPEKKKYKLSKKEIQNIISYGWEGRRQASKEHNAKNSAAVKRWKAREVLFEGKDQHLETVRRFNHYIGNGPVRNM